MTAKTTAQRQDARRIRLAEQELFEVRNIYLPKALHPELKAIAKRMLSKHEKNKESK